ncbi:MAG: hypothetical protein IPL79_07730 [Myxococcales bacterium]|nr:hypothetical protein [Myxococcales bacterium]
MSKRLLFAAMAACLAAGCDGASEPANPCSLFSDGSPGTCLSPWPSLEYLAEDRDTATGFHIDINSGAMPVNYDNVAADSSPFALYDGFAPTGPILVGFASGVSAEGLIGPDDIAQSVAPGASILLLDLETGQRLPYFAEPDAGASSAREQLLIIRPVTRLPAASRMLVVITSQVRAADGSALVRPPAFDALVRGASFDHPAFARMQAHFPAWHDAIDAQAVAMSEVVLAWEFVTASDEMLTRDLTVMSGLALNYLQDLSASQGFEVVEETPLDDGVKHLLFGSFDSANFLSGEDRLEASVLVRDDAGAPTLQGAREASLVVIVPKCIDTAPAQLPVIMLGHGVFGAAAGFLEDRLFQSVAERYCVILVATDYNGLAERQIPLVPLIVNDLNRTPAITDKIPQGVIDFIALEHLVRGNLGTSPYLQRDNASMIDTSQVYYLGGSLGGTMGHVFMAYDPHVMRATLGVAGGMWSMLLERSNAWILLQGTARAAYATQFEYQLLIALLGLRIEPYDSATTAQRVLADPMPGVPAKQILLYEAVGDALVSNYVTESMARTMGLATLAPATRPVYDIEATAGPLTSAFMAYDEAPTPLPSLQNIPPSDDNGTHGGIHGWAALLDQIEEFTMQGVINNYCTADGLPAPCLCATGACGSKQ